MSHGDCTMCSLTSGRWQFSLIHRFRNSIVGCGSVICCFQRLGFIALALEVAVDFFLGGSVDPSGRVELDEDAGAAAAAGEGVAVAAAAAGGAIVASVPSAVVLSLLSSDLASRPT